MKLLFLLVSLFLDQAFTTQKCFSEQPKWSTSNGNLMLNGKDIFHMKGTSWFGFETETHAPHGLWSKSVSFFLDFLKDNGFNAMRMPFAVKLVFDNPETNVDCGSNPKICNLKALDLMDHIIDEAGKRGILVMLDQHHLNDKITDLWYDSYYTEEKVLESWKILLKRFATKWNVFALDLKNEPHGSVTWGYDVKKTDWNRAAERIIKYIGTNFPQYQGFFFVEGVGENAKTTTANEFNHFWAENLEGVHKYPIKTGIASLDNRVVYSPHVYGPDVYMQNYFHDAKFPENMPRIWDVHFGFAEAKTGHAVVIGEWGGKYVAGTKDRDWQDKIASYLKDKCLTDQFYWCLNPNSGDTGGLINDDWSSPNKDKLKLLSSVQPNPSKLIQMEGKYCFEPGKSSCSGSQTTPQPPTTKKPTPTDNPTPTKETTPTDKPTPSTKPTPTKETTPTDKPTPSTKPTPTEPTTTGDSSSKGLVIKSIVGTQWEEDGQTVSQIGVVLKNTGDRKICGGRIGIVPRQIEIEQKWNLEDTEETGVFTFPTWLNIQPDQEYKDTGMIVTAEDAPKFDILEVKYC